MGNTPGVHLVRTEENVAEIDALAGLLGGRVGLEPMLGDLDRRGRRGLAPGLAVHRAYTWDRQDRRDERWWPQGVSTSADASDTEEIGGRKFVAVAWYAKELPGDDRYGGKQGSRVSFFDLGSRRYRHVLLVVPRLRDGVLSLEPLRVHAGGIVWAGKYLHVAATAKGLMTCRLDDLLRVPEEMDGNPRQLRVAEDRVSAYGYRYVLPVRFAYQAVTDDGFERLRYSFASLDRGADPPAVMVGEYGRGKQTTRIASFPVDPATGLLTSDEGGRSTPLRIDDGGVVQSQGIAMVGDTAYVTVSRGRKMPGSVFVGRPGAFREHRWAVPMGPEDVTWWPSTDLLWTATEYPRRRWIVSMKRSRLR